MGFSHIILETHNMDVFYTYSYGSAAWLALQAAPLIVSPTIIITLLSPDVREASPLEQYFSRSLGLTLLTLGIMIVLLTGSVPLTSLGRAASWPASGSRRRSTRASRSTRRCRPS